MAVKKEGFYPSKSNRKPYILNNKKGQITLFIIAGIILVIIAAGIFLASRKAAEAPLIPEMESIPSEIEPVRTYTLECITDVSKQGFKKLGEQGGFIETDEFSINYADPTGEGVNAIQFSKNSNLRIPYWRYLISDNKCDQKSKWCLFSSNRPIAGLSQKNPEDDSVESQISRYVSDNLGACINNYAAFYGQGYKITESDSYTTKVIIGEADVTVYVQHPIDIEIGDKSTKISNFYIALPLNFKRIYELAEELTNAEQNYTFIEKNTLNLITSFSGLDTNKLPPKTELTFEPGKYTTWTTQSVKKKIEEMLMVYTPALKVYGTKNFERVIFSDDVQQSLYDQMTVPLNLNHKYDLISANFVYLGWWPLYIDMNQGSQVIKPDAAFNPILPIIDMKRYSNTYDISYPVLAVLTDSDAYYGEGYTFMFALESNIRNNKPMKSVDDFSNLGGYTAFQSSLFCNEQQKTSAENTIIVIDRRDNNPVSDANIIYICGEESCYIGYTNESGALNTKLPLCLNGVVSAFKDGYFIPSKILSTDLDEGYTVAVDAWPFVEKNIIIKELQYNEDTNSLGIAVPMMAKESAVISMEKIKELEGEEDVSISGQIDNSVLSYTAMRIVPGIYNMDIDVFLHEPVIVDDEVCYKTGLFGLGKEKCEKIYVVFNDSFNSAGARLNQENSPVVLKASDVYSDKDIVFYAVSEPLPEKAEDLEKIGRFSEYSYKFRDQLEPVFEKIS